MLENERGNIAIVASIAISLLAGLHMYHSRSSVLKALDISRITNASDSGYDSNISGLGVYASLTKPDKTGKSAIYPDPYIPARSASMEKMKPSPESGSWGASGGKVVIKSNVYSGKKKKVAPTQIEIERFVKADPTRPYLITQSDVVSSTEVVIDKKGNTRRIETAAVVDIPEPPPPSCSVETEAVPTTRPFECLTAVTVKTPLEDEEGKPVLDEAGNPLFKLEEKKEIRECGGSSFVWDVEVDVGEMVSYELFGNGVIVEASMESTSGIPDTPNINIPKASDSIPFPEARSVNSLKGSLYKNSFAARNTAFYKFTVRGPQGAASDCIFSVHVNKGPEFNTEGDSYAKGSLVLMENGEEKPIESLKRGDRVFNPMSSNISEVGYVAHFRSHKSMVDISYSGREISVTFDHPFRT